jgi:two-component system, chemotaxis family, CheB/CheR fusion protein
VTEEADSLEASETPAESGTGTHGSSDTATGTGTDGAQGTATSTDQPGEASDGEGLTDLLDHLRATRGFDFTGYKRSSLTRRIRKRMDGLHVTNFDSYRRYLDLHDGEFVELFNTILINVTGFFRDPDTWELLSRVVIPRVVAERDKDDPIRAWVPGCASGEEAYSLAMLLCDALGEDLFRQRVKIYATDVDQEALGEARQGRYLKRSVVDALPPAMLDRFFEPDDTHIMFRKDLRRTVIFGRHDLVQDPPISRIDLLSCRNTLIYFTPAAQTRILANLHFALRPSGFLVLGRSEALATRTALFTPFDFKRRVFQTNDTGRGRRLVAEDTVDPVPTLQPAEQASDLRVLGFDMAPVAQLVLDVGGILLAANQHARTLFGLTPREVGRPVQDLEISYRPLELRSRLDTVYADRHAVWVRGVEWRMGADIAWFDVLFSPIANGAGALDGTGVSFVDVTSQRRLQDELQRSKADLESAYEELQSAVEELETTNEELQSTNEELETTNEELQSTNEELETTNDELQSTNEELETTNEELRQRTGDLDEVNAFLESILTSLDSAVVVVDRNVRIQVWNRHAHDLWGLRYDEVVGEHLMNLDIGLPLEHLRQPVRSCLTGEEEQQSLVVPAVNRRGRAIDCEVRVTPLLRGDQGQNGDAIVGAILLIDARDGTAGPAPPET